MKAITICQPYAHLIVTPQALLPDDPRFVQKRIENRRWHSRYRGPLLIHAGLSKSFLRGDMDLLKACPDMRFGFIVGVVHMVDCLTIDHAIDEANLPTRMKWIAKHKHTEGPFCFVLDDAHWFLNPIPYEGKLGLWEYDERQIAERLVSGESGKVVTLQDYLSSC